MSLASKLTVKCLFLCYILTFSPVCLTLLCGYRNRLLEVSVSGAAPRPYRLECRLNIICMIVRMLNEAKTSEARLRPKFC